MNLVVVIGTIVSLVRTFTDAISTEDCLSMPFDSDHFADSMVLYRQCVAAAERLPAVERRSYLTRVRRRFDATWSDLADKVGIAPYRFRFLPDVRKRSPRGAPPVFSYDEFPPPIIPESPMPPNSDDDSPEVTNFVSHTVLVPLNESPSNVDYPLDDNIPPVVAITDVVYTTNFIAGLIVLFSVIFCLSLCFIVKSWCLTECLIIDCRTLCSRS